jgi:hypothetical protein
VGVKQTFFPCLSKALRDSYAEAEPLYQRSLAIWEKALGPERPEVATGLENYAALLREMGRAEKELESRAHAIRAKHAEQTTVQ